MAAGLEKTALMASWGAAIPVPPMAREMGPIPIRLSPLVAMAVVASISVQARIAINKMVFLIAYYLLTVVKSCPE